jgi:hypothetical protein
LITDEASALSKQIMFTGKQLTHTEENSIINHDQRKALSMIQGQDLIYDKFWEIK